MNTFNKKRGYNKIKQNMKTSSKKGHECSQIKLHKVLEVLVNCG